MLEILVGVLLLPGLAYFAANVALFKNRREAGSAWGAILSPYGQLEGFWRIVFLHLAFAGIALVATVSTHLRRTDLGIFAIIVLILGHVFFAFLSQMQLNDEVATPMADADRKKVCRIGVLVLLWYALSVGLVAYDVSERPGEVHTPKQQEKT